jgi:hypothetical protein
VVPLSSDGRSTLKTHVSDGLVAIAKANYPLQLKNAGANYIWYSAHFFTFSSEERLWQALAPRLCSVVA